MCNTGDKPGKGQYRCTTCGAVVELENDSDELPPCPRCGNKTYWKIA